MKVKEIPLSLYSQTKLTYKSKEKLVASKKQLPIMVSLASIPSRLSIVHLAIRSILNQNVLPEKIVLWLHKDLESKIPKKLSALVGSIFEIRYSEETSSHRKLVETLKIYPQSTVITCDDDMMYRSNWLSQLYKMHKDFPNKIVANQVRCIAYDKNEQLLSYKDWPFTKMPCTKVNNALPIGAGGTLYPHDVLHPQVLDKVLYMKLAPKADDLWFKAMALLKGTVSIPSSYAVKEPIPIWGSQKVSLKKINISEDKNRTQWLALTEHFNLKL
ncbi:zinc-binding alcohol dehydrogenase [Flagellimonas allohymeniacidonis]|uniref:Zinc-binding alcohol dehydrogenase n=1 Tax=Flagellimonas allohymeniacidonis TaxID=2517819 RepID=A0A4Q8QLG3_9FLAO|nr:zinc-binding alcohol dehydrogenase [Allomuricauda hymeniacidonis]TAI49389.1 zinc-binding alcohol dehydrogenase [Allomuricauda hymeniacidonis]